MRRKKEANATAEKPIGVKLMMPPAVYETAKAEARRNNIPCVGTQIRIDVVRYYEGVAKRRGRKVGVRGESGVRDPGLSAARGRGKKLEKRARVRGGVKFLKKGRSLVKNIMA